MYKYLLFLALASYGMLFSNVQVKWKTLLPPTGIPDSYVNSSAISSDNSKVYYSGSSGIHMVDFESGEYLGLLEGSVGCYNIALSPDDRYIYAVTMTDLYKIDIEAKQVVRQFDNKLHGTLGYISLSPDGTKLAATSSIQGLMLINTETMELVKEVRKFPTPWDPEAQELLYGPTGISYSHDERYVAMSSWKDYTVVYDLEQDKTVNFLRGTYVNLSSNDRRAVVVTNTPNVSNDFTGFAYYSDFLQKDTVFIKMSTTSKPSCAVLAQSNYIAMAAGGTKFQIFNTESKKPDFYSAGEYQIEGICQSKDARYISGAGTMSVLFDLISLSAPLIQDLPEIHLGFNELPKEAQIENRSELLHILSFTLSNLAGQTLLNETVPLAPQASRSINLSSYPSGTYILSLRSSDNKIKSLNINIAK